MKKIFSLCFFAFLCGVIITQQPALAADSRIILEDLHELHALVFDEPRLTALELDNITDLDISTYFDRIVIRTEGDRLVVRYYEWMENHYTLLAEDGRLTISNSNMPAHIREFPAIPGIITYVSTIYCTGWYIDYLRSLGKRPDRALEITLPETEAIESLFISTDGEVDVSDSTFNTVTIMSGGGRINVSGSVFEAGRLASGGGMFSVTDSEFDSLHISGAVANAFVRLLGSAENYNISISGMYANLFHNGTRVGERALQNREASSSISFSGFAGSLFIADGRGN